MSLQEGNVHAGCPRVSFALPVRNGEGTLERALESLRTQDFPDFEVVVSDNASTDATEAIVRDFAGHDPRFRYFRNEQDVGQIDNFNRVVGLSRGRYFRWIGADDYLEPNYTSRCVATLEAHPEAIGVTTLWKFVDNEGNEEFVEYAGSRPDSPDVNARLSRTLWFLQANPLFFDPIYSMLRRSSLDRTNLLPVDPWTDRVLAMELCLVGPYCHVHECLATRRRGRELCLERFHPKYSEGNSRRQIEYADWRMYAAMGRVVRDGPLSKSQQLRGLASVFGYWIRSELRRPVNRIVGIIRRRLPG